jgi:hypothetical protein
MRFSGGEGERSSAERHARFLAPQLRAFGLQIELAPGAASAEVVLPLGTTPFETLCRPLLVERVRSDSPGHEYLTLLRPGVFVDLPALDVTRRASAANFEAEQRRALGAIAGNPGEQRERPLARLESANELRERAARSSLVPTFSAPDSARPIAVKRAPSAGAQERSRRDGQPAEPS